MSELEGGGWGGGWRGGGQVLIPEIGIHAQKCTHDLFVSRVDYI